MNFLNWRQRYSHPNKSGHFTVHTLNEMDSTELQKSHEEQTNWTLCIDGEGVRRIVNGWAFVDRECFLITPKPWDGEPHDILVTNPFRIDDPQGGYY